MKNKISRRQFLQVAGASAAALLLASCSGNSASSVSSSSVASSEAASSAAASSEATSTVTTTGKTLVVYFSATGTTQGVAQTIADTVGADLFEVVPSDPYTSDDLNWTNNDSRVSREHNDEGLRAVALESTDVDGWDDYDTVFIGYPIWWGIAAWPMSSFVAVNDFTGKNVVPFCTSLSSGIGQSGKLLAELADAGTWLDGQRFSHSSSEADAFVIGAPVYFGSPAGGAISFMDRLFFSTLNIDKTMKVGASVVTCRRGGNTASYDVLNKYFTMCGMPVASSQYWNMVYGGSAEEVKKDAEGLQTMRTLGRNMAFLMKSIQIGKQQIGLPEKEPAVFTNFHH